MRSSEEIKPIRANAIRVKSIRAKHRIRFSNSVFISIMLSILMIVALSGCSNSSLDGVNTSEKVTQATPVPTSTSTSTPTQPPAETDNISVPTSTINPNQSEEQGGSNVSGSLKVHYIDVGQGDSELILLPNNQVILIDAGDASSGVSGYLKSLGIKRIDYLIVSHAHADHIGGMESVVNSFDIGKVYMPKKSTTTKTFENLLKAIQNKGLKINTAQAGVVILDEPGLKVDLLGPVSVSTDNLNNTSSIVKLTFGNNKFLFIGDAETDELNTISGDLSCDVLKVGHHGSRTSTTSGFISRVKPKYGVISSGAGNSYGHPHSEVLNILSNAGVKVYRTDEVGTIVITSDGTNITLNKNATEIQANAPPVSGSVSSSSSSSSGGASSSGAGTVYRTNTGAKYHRDGCSSLSKSKIPITVSEAQGMGLEPCKKCNP